MRPDYRVRPYFDIGGERRTGIDNGRGMYANSHVTICF
jgi:hypothetical protein